MVRQQKPLDQLVQTAESILLTDADIRRLTNDELKIMMYEELLNYNTIDEVFGNYEGICLLYENSKFSGHWCLLTRLNATTLYFFDSYSIQLDEEIKWSKYLVKKGFKTYPALTLLIKKSGYKLQQNQIKYQQLENGVNTCGSHVCCRFIYRHLNDQEYSTFIKGNRYYGADFWVTVLIRGLDIGLLHK